MTIRAGLLLATATALFATAPDATKNAPREAPLFKLTDPRTSKPVDLKEIAARKQTRGFAVVFLGTQCPVNNDFIPELNSLAKEYELKGIFFVGVNANRQDSPAAVAEHARKYSAGFPIVKDPTGDVAERFGAKRTPEAFLLSASGKILYQGRIDDQFGIGYRRPGKPTRKDLAVAMDEFLSGKTVAVSRTEVAGCIIGRAPKSTSKSTITYAKQISRILQKNCQECHRPGQIGPMALGSYDDAVSWGETIREVIDDGRMPPWHADARYGKWSNQRSLTKEDKEAIRTWVKEGMPRGEDADLPTAIKYPEGWQIGKPDVVFRMPTSFDVPAKTPPGGVPYKYYSVETNFTEDRWIERAEARPGAPEVVHHILVFIVPKGHLLRMEKPGTVLAGMAPGDMPLMLKPGQAKKVPAGSRLVFQMHYTPNGRAQKDRSSVGVIFAKNPPRQEVLTKPIMNPRFATRWISIPQGADNFEVEATDKFKTDIKLIAFMPHMHLRGKDFRYEIITPDGKKEILLSIPNYNFNWQSVYRTETPITLKKGNALHCVAHFDNSAKNPSNPDPKKQVYWGDQTWEEMMIGWIDYIEEK